ncbi:hypothetical protein GF108_13475 [Phyllobacterium sp. SYP-B3895]|uniref:hypothetical protein n=1 Tax=Phyllobacterium sp. SYP-B3895 TaxID=2663240 RepID=UPI001299C22C|nr:hypothetical protein [Phyllobacterium sp. SYP-B3895]MRG56587.1 hypothetical protein [Phyllobacterium sp. SYP-B3895]
MHKRSHRYDTRESLMEVLKELVALQVPAEDVAPVLCTIGPVDLDLLDDCMDAIGFNDNQSVAA